MSLAPWQAGLLGLDFLGNMLDRGESLAHFNEGERGLHGRREQERDAAQSPFRQEAQYMGERGGALADRRETEGRANIDHLRNSLLGTQTREAGDMRNAQMNRINTEENDRIRQLEATLNPVTDEARANYAQVTGLIMQGLHSAQERLGQSLDTAYRNIDEVKARTEGQAAELRGIFDQAFIDSHDRSIAETQEQAGAIETSLSDSETQINNLTGQVPPQVQERMRQQTRLQHRKMGLDGVRQVRAAHDTRISALHQARAGTMAGHFGMMETAIGNANALAVGAGIQAAELNPEQSAATALQNANVSFSDTMIRAASTLDQARQFRANIINQVDFASGNNYLQMVSKDMDVEGMLFDLEDGFSQENFANRMGIENMMSGLRLQSIGTELDLTKMLASAHFGWQNTIIPWGQATGTLFDDTMQIMNLQLAQANIRAQERAASRANAGMIGGSALSMAGMVGGAVILS